MKRSGIFGIVFVMILILASMPASISAKTKIEKKDDLPRHTYKIDVPAADFLDKDAPLLKLAGEVRQDLESDLDKYEILDETTLKEYYSTLGMIARIEGRDEDNIKYLEMVRDLEDKEAVKLTSGLFSESVTRALMKNPDKPRPLIKEYYAKMIEPLPYDVVGNNLKQAKAMGEIFSRNFLLGLINDKYQPIIDEANGEISKDIATTLLGYGNSTRYYLPYKDILVQVVSDYLNQHKVTKPDIWAARSVSLEGRTDGKPVIVCVWDSGVDTTVYRDILWKNTGEIPNNGKDDDNDGFVDDYNGIAYTLHSDKTPDLLYPIGDVKDAPRLQRMMKGLSDLQANIESEESQELKQQLAQLKPQDARPFIEGIAKYGNYAHGSHVAGIAVKDNPFARLMVARLTFDYHLVPEEPTIEQAKKDSAATDEMVKYFKDHGARVVNMSWGGSLSDVEAALEANNAGGTPEERKELARKIFEIGKTGLREAMRNAPEILFVTSAGNSDNDVEFDEVIPSSFDLPNLIVVGAVDHAGDETSFTSFGKVDVYANGFNVESNVPGGNRLKMSGTSQASPNVVNLAAKILAIRPDLTPTQVRDLIEKGSDEKEVGDRTIRLINPKKTMELLSSL